MRWHYLTLWSFSHFKHNNQKCTVYIFPMFLLFRRIKTKIAFSFSLQEWHPNRLISVSFYYLISNNKSRKKKEKLCNCLAWNKFLIFFLNNLNLFCFKIYHNVLHGTNLWVHFSMINLKENWHFYEKKYLPCMEWFKVTKPTIGFISEF